MRGRKALLFIAAGVASAALAYVGTGLQGEVIAPLVLQSRTAAIYEPADAVVAKAEAVGMVIANVPAVWMGEALAHRINMKRMRWVAAGLFVLLGGLTLLAGDDAVRIGCASGSAHELRVHWAP